MCLPSFFVVSGCGLCDFFVLFVFCVFTPLLMIAACCVVVVGGGCVFVI